MVFAVSPAEIEGSAEQAAQIRFTRPFDLEFAAPKRTIQRESADDQMTAVTDRLRGHRRVTTPPNRLTNEMKNRAIMPDRHRRYRVEIDDIHGMTGQRRRRSRRLDPRPHGVECDFRDVQKMESSDSAVEQSVGEMRNATSHIDHDVVRFQSEPVDGHQRWSRIGLIPAGLGMSLVRPDLVPMSLGRIQGVNSSEVAQAYQRDFPLKSVRINPHARFTEFRASVITVPTPRTAGIGGHR